MPQNLTAADGTSLHLHVFEAKDPKAWLLILHGYGEHGGRYDHVAEALSSYGISCLAIDFRGHGRSAGTRGFVKRFDEYHLDASAAAEELRKRAQGLPMFLFGHSNGALVSLHWALHGGAKDFRGMILTSPFLGVAVAVPKIKATLGRVMSEYWPTLALPAGLKGCDVARDPKFSAIYDTDPLNNKNATARWYTEALAAIDRVQAGVGALSMPLLLLYGGADRVAKPEESDRLAAKLTMSDRTVERMEGSYHELVHEPAEVRAKVFQKIGEWVRARLG